MMYLVCVSSGVGEGRGVHLHGGLCEDLGDPRNDQVLVHSEREGMRATSGSERENERARERVRVCVCVGVCVRARVAVGVRQLTCTIRRGMAPRIEML